MPLSPLDFEQAIRDSHSVVDGALKVLDHVWDGKSWNAMAQPLEEGGSVVVSGVLQADNYVWNGKAWVEMAQPLEDGGQVDCNGSSVAVSNMVAQPVQDGGTLKTDNYVWNGKAWVEMAQPLKDGGSVTVSGTVYGYEYFWNGAAWVAGGQPVQDGGTLKTDNYVYDGKNWVTMAQPLADGGATHDYVYDGKGWNPMVQPLASGGTVMVGNNYGVYDNVWDGKGWVAMSQPIQDGGKVDCNSSTVTLANSAKIDCNGSKVDCNGSTVNCNGSAVAATCSGTVAVSSVPSTTLAKTAGTIQAWTTLAATTWAKSAAYDVSTKLSALIDIEFSLATGVAPTATTFYIEGSAVDSGDEAWVPLGTDYTFTTGTTAAQSSGVDGTVKAGDTVVSESATGTLAAGDLVCFINGTLGNSEIGRVVAVTPNTNFTLLDGVTRAQTGANWYSKAERFCSLLMLDGIKRIRVVVLSGSQACIWRALITTANSIG